MAEHFDTIIVGAGLGGLTCGALLAKAGQKVLVLEKNQRLGGYATSYKIKGHSFDIATQALGGCDPQGPVREILEELGVGERINFLPCEPARVYYFAGETKPYVQHGFLAEQQKFLSEEFPDFKESLGRCFKTWAGILAELQSIAEQSSGQAFSFSRDFPLLAKYGRMTVQGFFDQERFSLALQERLAARAGYCMLSLDRLSLVGFACTEISFANGAWMVEGGVSRLPEALAESIENNGGRIVKKARVNAINTDGREVSGIRTVDGKQYLARNVVVACDARRALHEWLDIPELPAVYGQKLDRMEESGSYFISYYQVPADTVKDLPPNLEVRMEGQFDLAAGHGPDVYYILIPSLVDRKSAPVGYHSFCLSVPLPASRILTTTERNRLRNLLEQEVVQRFPSLEGKLTWLFELAPNHLTAMTGNPQGAAYGWAQTVEQAGIYRLNITTPVPGLFLTGHWTMPGGGIAGVMTSGRLCAKTVMGAAL